MALNVTWKAAQTNKRGESPFLIKDKIMNTVEIINRLGMKFESVYDLKVAVNNHRKLNPEWNWIDAAENLLQILEGK